MTPPDLLTLTLATAYLTFVTVNTDGLFGMFAFVRKHDPVKATHCMFCFAFWSALLMLALYLWTPLVWLVQAFAIAGGALMLLAFSGVKHL